MGLRLVVLQLPASITTQTQPEDVCTVPFRSGWCQLATSEWKLDPWERIASIVCVCGCGWGCGCGWVWVWVGVGGCGCGCGWVWVWVGVSVCMCVCVWVNDTNWGLGASPTPCASFWTVCCYIVICGSIWYLFAGAWNSWQLHRCTLHLMPYLYI